jgi:hypothetical protein
MRLDMIAKNQAYAMTRKELARDRVKRLSGEDSGARRQKVPHKMKILRDEKYFRVLSRIAWWQRRMRAGRLPRSAGTRACGASPGAGVPHQRDPSFHASHFRANITKIFFHT